MSDFKKGDVVRLKSGGPAMTVSGVGSYTVIEDGVECTWFEGKQLRSEVFDRAVLEPVTTGASTAKSMPWGT